MTALGGKAMSGGDGAAGEELARLDELEAVTRQYAKASWRGLGTWATAFAGLGLLVAGWLARLDTAASLFASAVVVVGAAAVLVVEARRLQLMWSPANGAEANLLRQNKTASMGWVALVGIQLAFLAYELAHDLPPSPSVWAGYGSLIAAFVLVVVVGRRPLSHGGRGFTVVWLAYPAANIYETGLRGRPWWAWGAGVLVVAACMALWRSFTLRRLDRRLTRLRHTAILPERAE